MENDRGLAIRKVTIAVLATILMLSFVIPVISMNAAAAASATISTNKPTYYQGETVTVSASWSGVYCKAGLGDPNVMLDKDGVTWPPYYYADSDGSSKSITRTITNPTVGTHTIVLWYATGWYRIYQCYLMSSISTTFTVLSLADDPDKDGLSNAQEQSYGTNPTVADTDGDLLKDGDEVFKYYTDPLKKDTDGDLANDNVDMDPLQNLALKATVKHVQTIDSIGSDGLASFYWTVTIGGSSSTSSKTAYPSKNDITPNWVFTADVSDTAQYVSVKFTLYDSDGTNYNLCDISVDSGGGDKAAVDGSDVELQYNLKSGDWYKAGSGDDYLGDYNGYGHVSGNEDGSYLTNQNDCEMWFDIVQVKLSTGTDTDGDGLTYWEEINSYSRNPKINDGSIDRDVDHLPLWWEDANGLSDNNAADRYSDRDYDGLNSMEEYNSRTYGCRIDYPDILVEIDYTYGNSPSLNSLNFIVDYYRTKQTPQSTKMPISYHGVHLYFEVNQEITIDISPEDHDVSEAELLNAKSAHFDSSREGIWRYCVFGDYLGGYVGPGGIIVHGDLGFTPNGEVPGDVFFIGAAEINLLVLDHMLNSFERGITGVLMHELGHCLGILKINPNTNPPSEWYCEDAPVSEGFGYLNCIMAGMSQTNVDARMYCLAHWQMLDIATGVISAING